MHKQTIEIEVPEGEEVDLVLNFSSGDYPALKSHALITFKKKEPEFIEVREYLMHRSNGKIALGVVNNEPGSLFDDPDQVQTHESFIKWIDKDWRKVEIVGSE